MKHVDDCPSTFSGSAPFVAKHHPIHRKLGYFRFSFLFSLPASIAVLVATASSTWAAEGAGTSSSNAPLWAAVVTGGVSAFSVIATLLYNSRTAAEQNRMATEQRKIASEADQKQGQRELGLKIIEMIASDETAKRRFAIGLLKVEDVDGSEEQSKIKGEVYFIPMNSRITAGRSDQNDIHIYDATLKNPQNDRNRYVSRFQCGFVADQNSVVLEDFASANGTLVSDSSGNEVLQIDNETIRFRLFRHRTLTDGDRIWIGPFVLRFVKLQENKVFSY